MALMPAFGKIIEGMDVVDKLAEVATDWSDMPLTPVIMEKVTVETLEKIIRSQKQLIKKKKLQTHSPILEMNCSFFFYFTISPI